MPSQAVSSWGDAQIRLTDRVSVLAGADAGRYPSGNSLLVVGDGEAVVIDPSVTVVEYGGAPVAIDAVINSHAHEDHLAGNGLFADARVHIHAADRQGAASLEGLLGIYGMTGEVADTFATTILEEFSYAPRPDAEGFHNGHTWDLGGVSIEAVHLPGHTRGHSGFRVSDGVFFLSDIDLTGFGPYYGDVWSDLDDFERSLEQVRGEDANWYVTFHQKGVIEGRVEFLRLLDSYHGVIGRRHQAMLEFLSQPRTVADMVAHRFIYRPHVEHSFADHVEARSADLHLNRMLTRGEAEQTDDGRYVAVV